jgi:hypothetical protein
MTISENLTRFYDKPVIDFRDSGDIKSFAAAAPRLRCAYDDERSLRDYLAQMLDEPGAEMTTALVFGLWTRDGETHEVTCDPEIEMLVAMKDRLPRLEAIFFGDITYEENEMSWIQQGNHAPIWGAFPELRTYAVRGSSGLRLGKINHPKLSTLIIQTGGMSRETLREALDTNAPLRHLELWLGDDGYGANTAVPDFAKLFSGALFPHLQHLGLCNSQYTDDLAAALVNTPLFNRLKAVDLSGGTLTDRGADSLLQSGRLSDLDTLDIRHNYLSTGKLEALAQACPNLVADTPMTPEIYDGQPQYYITVSE